MKLFKDIKNLIAGLGITGKHLGRHAITLQYPEEKWTMPERSRGVVVLLSDKESGELNCTGCLICMKACPSAAIEIDAPRDPETKKRTLLKFTVDNALCCYCGLCEEACNFSAIKMANNYEMSMDNKDEFVWDMKKLQEMGIDTPYIDTRKKKKPKPEPKPAVAANPGEAVPEAKADVKPENKTENTSDIKADDKDNNNAADAANNKENEG